MRIEITEEEKDILLKCLLDSMTELNKLSESKFIDTNNINEMLNVVHKVYNKVVYAHE